MQNVHFLLLKIIGEEARVPRIRMPIAIDIFLTKPVMSVLLPFLHTYDIINLAQTCRCLYTSYYGDTFDKTLSVIVKRDVNETYLEYPLSYLGGIRHIGDREYKRLPKLKFAHCVTCAKAISGPYQWNHITAISGIVCYSCQRSFGFFKMQFKKLHLLQQLSIKYSTASVARVQRLVMRHGVKYGRLIETANEVSAAAKAEKIKLRKEMHATFLAEIQYLDLEVYSVPAGVYVPKFKVCSDVDERNIVKRDGRRGRLQKHDSFEILKRSRIDEL